jgi:hypothetical protein
VSARTSLFIIPADEKMELLVTVDLTVADPQVLWNKGLATVGPDKNTLIERVRTIHPSVPWMNDDRWRLWVNEDGLQLELPVNRRASRLYRGSYQLHVQPIYGDALLVAYDGGEEDYALTTEEASFFKQWLTLDI